MGKMCYRDVIPVFPTKNKYKKRFQDTPTLSDIYISAPRLRSRYIYTTYTSAVAEGRLLLLPLQQSQQSYICIFLRRRFTKIIMSDMTPELPISRPGSSNFSAHLCRCRPLSKTSVLQFYCGWRKSCTTAYSLYPNNCGILGDPK